MKIQSHLGMLGLNVKDRVTGFSGVVTSVTFDLYGCIQALVHPGMAADGKMGELQWFDINRVQPLSQVPVMERPDFVEGPVADGLKGAAEKPVPGRA